MRVLQVRNVHKALPAALRLLYEVGIERPSRNGPVLQAPEPVATVYTHPNERVIFHPERDANPFYHLYEALWMLAGRNDIAPLTRYAKNAVDYSDDGQTWHGAYGYRWRNHFRPPIGPSSYGFGMDQLPLIAHELQASRESRRAVLAMWDAAVDLGRKGKDLPCNDTATFQIGPDGRLDLVVFCRSNDIVWGAYGANAVHFSLLLEYMAAWIGVEVGTYTQISVNWHGYLSTLEKVRGLPEQKYVVDPYVTGEARHVSMWPKDWANTEGTIDQLDRDIRDVLLCADMGFSLESNATTEFAQAAYVVLRAHHIYKSQGAEAALGALVSVDQRIDWVKAAREWLLRRVKKVKCDGNHAGPRCADPACWNQ